MLSLKSAFYHLNRGIIKALKHTHNTHTHTRARARVHTHRERTHTVNIDQNAKYQAYSPHLSWDRVVLRILQTDWPKTLLFQPSYKFSDHLSLFKKSCWLNQSPLRYGRLMNPDWFLNYESHLTGPEQFPKMQNKKLTKKSFTIFESRSAYKKSNSFINFYWRYSWFKNSAIW